MKLEVTKDVKLEPWMNFYWYNVPDKPVLDEAFTSNLRLDLQQIPHRLDRPFCIFKSNGPIKDLEQTKHDEKTVKYLNQKGLSIYLTEPICSYIDGWRPPNVYATKHTMWFYSEFYKGEDLRKLRADELDSIKIYIEKNNLTNVTVHTGDYGIQIYYKYYLKYMNLITDDLFLKSIHDLYFVEDFPEPKFSKKFICLNWRYTKHRHMMAAYVSQLPSYVSWYYKTSLEDLSYKLWFPWTDLEQCANEQYYKLLDGIKNLQESAPLDIDLGISNLTEFKHHHFFELWPRNNKFDPGETPNRDPRQNLRPYYDDVFCDIVTETRYAQPTGNYSEKVYQAAVFLKPFILVGAPRSLEYARSQGFKTFSDFWDESYDLEQDPGTRLGKILKLIDYINSLSIEQLREMYKAMKPILVHNRDLIYNNFIKYRIAPGFNLKMLKTKSERKILIAGCSHAAGSEIDGTEDSTYNRAHSFGNLLGQKLGSTPINIAVTGASNSCIARSVIEWIDQNSTDDLAMVLVAWTDSSRLEVPFNRIYPYQENNPAADWFTKSCQDYMRVNMGHPGGDIEEQQIVPFYQRFIAQELPWIELYNLNLILQTEFYLKSKSIDFLMCNTQPIFAPSTQTKFYESLIDKNHFHDFGEIGFYWKYRNLGFTNKNAKYLHHDEGPHELYAQELYEKIIDMRG